jgi:hypothetical protein
MRRSVSEIRFLSARNESRSDGILLWCGWLEKKAMGIFFAFNAPFRHYPAGATKANRSASIIRGLEKG